MRSAIESLVFMLVTIGGAYLVLPFVSRCISRWQGFLVPFAAVSPDEIIRGLPGIQGFERYPGQVDDSLLGHVHNVEASILCLIMPAYRTYISSVTAVHLQTEDEAISLLHSFNRKLRTRFRIRRYCLANAYGPCRFTLGHFGMGLGSFDIVAWQEDRWVFLILVPGALPKHAAIKSELKSALLHRIAEFQQGAD